VTVRVQEVSLDVRTLGLVASDRVLDSGDLSADFFLGLWLVRCESVERATVTTMVTIMPCNYLNAQSTRCAIIDKMCEPKVPESRSSPVEITACRCFR
jgi:hypothetical protein